MWRRRGKIWERAAQQAGVGDDLEHDIGRGPNPPPMMMIHSQYVSGRRAREVSDRDRLEDDAVRVEESDHARSALHLFDGDIAKLHQARRAGPQAVFLAPWCCRASGPSEGMPGSWAVADDFLAVELDPAGGRP